MKKLSVAALLKSELKRMQRQNRAYSLRALARDLDISASFLSALLSGKRPFPKKRLDDFAKALRMDEASKEQLARAVDSELFAKTKLAISPESRSETALSKFKTLPDKSVSLLDHWYNVAILDLAHVEKGLLNPSVVSKRLGITSAQAKMALDFLTAHHWLKLEDGRYVKNEELIRIPTRNSRSQVRDFHKEMIRLALQNLVSQTDPEAFNSRLITGVTFSANPKNLEKARIRLTEALYEVADILMEGDCTEVYQLNGQLFKLTK